MPLVPGAHRVLRELRDMPVSAANRSQLTQSLTDHHRITHDSWTRVAHGEAEGGVGWSLGGTISIMFVILMQSLIGIRCKSRPINIYRY